MLKVLKADLHIHTCLSPCAEMEMSPVAIVEQARKRKIDILGICDHNSAENVPSVLEAAKKHRICVLPGLEVTSREEVHILALFDGVDAALELQGIVYGHLPGENDPEVFGMQVIVDAGEEVLGYNEKLLIGATTLSVEEIVQITHILGGLAIAAHIDRESFSLIGQLGFVPDELELDALEISPNIGYEGALKRYSPRLPLACSSDAHFLDDIGRSCTSFYVENGSIVEIRRAFLEEDKRKIIH